MATVFIPTRNRPTSLKNVLSHFSSQAPGTKICIADGSDADNVLETERMIHHFKDTLDISFFHYDADLSYIKRIVDCLERINDDFVTMGADDDYIDMNVINRCQDFLVHNTDYSLCMGYRIDLDARHKDYIRASFFHAFSVEMDSVVERMKYFSDWSFATTYSLTTKEHIINRCTMIRDLDIQEYDPENDTPVIYGFMDFLVGLFDLAHGKIKVLPELACVSTKVHIFKYLRSQDPLSYLNQSGGILKIRELIRDVLITQHGIPAETAARESSLLMRKRLGELLGGRMTNLHNFASNHHFRDPDVIKQIRAFNAMFQEDSLQTDLATILQTANGYAVALMKKPEASVVQTKDRGQPQGRPTDSKQKEVLETLTESDVELYKYLDPRTLIELDEPPESTSPR